MFKAKKTIMYIDVKGVDEKLKIHLVVDAEMTKAQLMDILKKADVI